MSSTWRDRLRGSASRCLIHLRKRCPTLPRALICLGQHGLEGVSVDTPSRVYPPTPRQEKLLGLHAEHSRESLHGLDTRGGEGRLPFEQNVLREQAP